MIRAGIIGATGYTGFELARILGRHPAVTVQFATSQSQAGRLLSDVYPAAPPLRLVAQEEAALGEVDVLFLCLPHGAAAPVAETALAAGVRVVDLSADFRLKDPAVYAAWYGQEHPAPHLLAGAVYGLTEFARPALRTARLVANPGCYPTSVLLALRPLLEAGAVGGTIIADSKSGVSGAGRAPRQDTHFVEVANNFSPYKIGRVHRHLPEMEQGLRCWQADPPPLIFSPHLLPVPRGILSTIYVPLNNGWSEGALRALYQETYADEPFVKVLPAGTLATLAHANHTNLCVIALTLAGDMLILTSAIDNLVKGAAGQAVQNMNVMFRLEEVRGLVE
ncbi:MAG: N-acetyl-gamma-glutamyl-phosphate reductase [Chloroflexi bacterium]|nr:N-acetyl-gamma-glutamyl-phosphate reductase [Chloroflexota bacterium]MCI0728473.1 N-acetyl-gamma-glutamyl-phosphate reductase [Chloroflexota bacterium]